MDINLLDAAPTDAEREAIDAVVGEADGARATASRRADRTRRQLLLPALRAAQLRVGWVSEGALGYASRRLSVPPADAYGVASFYALLALEERPADVTHVCTDLSCALKGAQVGPGEHPSPCLGLCERAPASYRTIAGVEPRELQLPADGAAAAAGGRPVAAPAAPDRRRDRPDVARRVRRGRRLRAAAARARARRRGGDRRAEGVAACSAAAAPRSRPASSGRPSRGSRLSRTTSSATPTSRSPGRSRTAC